MTSGELLRRDGQYIYFGRWPQSVKAADVSVVRGVGASAQVKDRPCYFTGSDGEIYMESAEYFGALKMSYFKVEPLKWRILEEKDGVALLLCENIIDAEFYGGNNCYWGSMLCDWLNKHFLDVAFTDEERKRILLSLIDNSAESTGIENNADACCDCEVHVFLLSYKEAFELYGLTDKDRQKKSTDYAESRCGGYSYCTDWYLRSPIPSRFSSSVRGVGGDGEVVGIDITEWFYGGSDGSDGATTGVVPAIRVRLN